MEVQKVSIKYLSLIGEDCIFGEMELKTDRLINLSYLTKIDKNINIMLGHRMLYLECSTSLNYTKVYCWLNSFSIK